MRGESPSWGKRCGVRQLSQFISDGIRIAGARNAINQKATAAGRGCQERRATTKRARGRGGTEKKGARATGVCERDGRKTSINTVGTTKISFRRRERASERANEARRFSLASRCTHKEAIITCVHSLARSRGRERAAHMHNSGATNASSHVRERNIKKRAEHKATGRRGGYSGARERGRKRTSERDAVGIKGEADKDRERKKTREGRRAGARGRSCVRKRKRQKDADAVGRGRQGGRTSRGSAGREGGTHRRRMYIKILFSDEIPGGAPPAHSARVYF